tara:strand:- start:257 stop:847 length:591 start_codon:yes stop_codon:yes gene_type:complete
MNNLFLKVSILSSSILLVIALIIYFKIDEVSKKNDLKFNTQFNLISHKGERVSEKILSSRPTIVFFGFTHCPEVCPTTLYEISSWINEIELSKEQIQVLFISLDPKRDTVQKLEEYLSNFDETFKGLTGDENEIVKLANSWGIYRKIVLTDDDYTIDHTSTIFLINQNSSLKGTIAYREHSDVAIAKIKNLIQKNQ